MDLAGKPYFIIAEIGVNHENSLDTAKRLIELAKEGGAHAAKFQAYKAGGLASRFSPAYWDTAKEPTTSQFELFSKHDAFDVEHYRRLAEHCGRVGIEFSCTAFDSDFLDALDPWVRYHKIASADITAKPLLARVASKGKPVVLSTGAASFLEVRQALEILTQHGSGPVTLLHCSLNYPTPGRRAMLSRIPALKANFPGHTIGYSDHTVPGEFCLPLVVAYVLGARVIEKHFTHDKSLPGNDHYHAADVHDLRALRRHLDEVAELVGDFDEARFLASQLDARQFARRSIVAARPIRRGESISPGAVTVKRPGTGISPMRWEEVLGRRAARDIAEDEVLAESDLIG
jgi:N-acetylneuraminate synthase